MTQTSTMRPRTLQIAVIMFSKKKGGQFGYIEGVPFSLSLSPQTSRVVGFGACMCKERAKPVNNGKRSCTSVIHTSRVRDDSYTRRRDLKPASSLSMCVHTQMVQGLYYLKVEEEFGDGDPTVSCLGEIV